MPNEVKAAACSSSFQIPHHRLETILKKSYWRPLLRWLSHADGNGMTRLERISENYDRDGRPRGWHRRITDSLITYGLRKARANKDVIKEKVLHHPPTIRSIALAARSIAEYGLTMPQRFSAPLIVVWNITQACNLSCIHCYQGSGRSRSASELKTAEKLNVIDQLGESLVPFVALAGGEPLMTPELYKLLDRFQQRHIHISMATNGVLLTNERCRRLKEAGVKYLEVSLDAPTAADHDFFRGVAGAWQRAVDGIRSSVAAGIRTGIACCFTRQNIDSAREMLEFAISLGAQRFIHFNFIPVGRAKDLAHLDLLPQQREELLLLLHEFLNSGRIDVLSTAPQFARKCIMMGAAESLYPAGHGGQGPGRKTVVLSRYIGGCGASRCYCSIQPDGRVTPCVYMPAITLGDLRERSFRDIWEQDNHLLHTFAERDGMGDHCGICIFRTYCGGCRARAYAYTGDLKAGDPGCMYNRHLWDKITGFRAVAEHSLPTHHIAT